MGEPTYFEYVLNNHSNKPFFVEEGGDYRSGRKISFKVLIIYSENDTLKKRELWGAMGGYLTYKKVLPKESRKFKLFLPVWGDIEKPGTYKLVVSKKFKIAPESPFHKKDNPEIQIVPKESTTTFTVIKDKKRMWEYIDTLVASIKKETRGRIISGGGFKPGEKSYKPLSRELTERLRYLNEIKDERIVPFFVECFREKKHLNAAKANSLLAQFPQNDLAFETLKYAAQGEVNSKCYVTEDSISIVWTSGDIRQTALLGIMKRNDDSAVDFLNAKINDDYPCERYMIVLTAKNRMSESNTMKIYKNFLNDKHKAVRRRAKEELEMLMGKTKTNKK